MSAWVSDVCLGQFLGLAWRAGISVGDLGALPLPVCFLTSAMGLLLVLGGLAGWKLFLNSSVIPI